jgi:hypothetical protein
MNLAHRGNGARDGGGAVLVSASGPGSGSISGHGMGVGEGGRKIVGIYTEVVRYAVGMILIALR